MNTPRLPILVATWLLLALAPSVGTAQPLASFTVSGDSRARDAVALDGVVEVVRQTTLSAQVAGAVVALRVKVGDRVSAGQELLRIDARAAQQNVAGSAAQVEAAQAALHVAATDLVRQKQLFEKQYISQGALDRSLAQYHTAQAQVNALQAQTRAAQAQSGFFVLNAPYAGVVSEVPATLGDMALPGKPLVTLHDPSALRITVAVPQTLLGGLDETPQGVRYDIPGLATGPQTAGTVQLLPTVDAATHTAQLRLPLPTAPSKATSGVAPGMFARVWLPAQGASSTAVRRLFVPAGAVVRRGEMSGVYVLDAQDRPRLRLVRLGATSADRIEVLTGLNPGERIATDAQAATSAR
jgi:RND family efflux transporter MFP subunit